MSLRVPVTGTRVGGAMLPDDSFGMKITFETANGAELDVLMPIDVLDSLLKQAKALRPAARQAARTGARHG